MKGLGEKVQWPPKMRQTGEKDMTKYCDFHEDFGHTTDNCFSLRKEVAELLKRGFLKEYLSDKAKRTVEIANERRRDGENKQPPPPKVDRTINTITGGSEACGYTRSMAKRKLREVLGVYTVAQDATREKDYEITFTSGEVEGLYDPHHDALVISITMANLSVRRVLIDNGSSANILFMGAFRMMQLDERSVRQKSVSLVGFSGESKSTMGEVDLQVFAEGINLTTTFLLVN